MTTIREAYKEGEEKLSAAGVADASRDSRTLLSLALGLPESRIILDGQVAAAPERLAAYRRMIDRRASGEPLQHIAGNTEFMGLPFIVRPGVLIPRQETEVLVECALDKLRSLSGAPVKVLDLCCGSGVIGIAVAKLAGAANGAADGGDADIEVTCSDISTDAIYLAHSNAELNGVADRMRFARGDLVETFRRDGTRFSMICCNPPYIPTAVIGTLQREVRDHDPVLALDGGYDGLDFYRRISSEAAEVVEQGGILILEIGAEQREAVTAILEGDGFFGNVECIKDLAGRDRVLTAERL